MPHEVMYRYESHQSEYGRSHVILHTYRILKRTPKGVWIRRQFSEDKFILLGTRKKFAAETQEAALESFRARKRRHISLLVGQLQAAEAALTEAAKIDNTKPPISKLKGSGLFDGLDLGHV